MARRILIGIAGGSGSGKTLVARTIVRELGSDRVVVIDQDSYYKNLEDIPLRDREARNFDHPDAFDNDLLEPEGGHNKVAIDLVQTKIRELLRERGVQEVPAPGAV